MKVSPGRLHRDRLLWAVPHGVLQDPVTWSALLDAFDAPEVVRALDPSGADEVLLGFEAATGAPLVHKLYLARATAAQGAALDSRLGPVEDGPGARVFDSVKWRPGLDDEVWRAVYDEPGPGPDAVDLVSGAFGRDAWRWAHAAIQLADVGPVLDVHASAVRPTMHAQNLLVTVDELGRTSFDARARWVADPVELIPSVRWLAREAGLSEADEDDLAVFASSRVERVIGGLAGDGSPFLTLYRASAPLDLGAAS
jgi:hypothetical protein